MHRSSCTRRTCRARTRSAFRSRPRQNSWRSCQRLATRSSGYSRRERCGPFLISNPAASCSTLIIFCQASESSGAPRDIYLTFNGTNNAVAASNSAMLAEGPMPLTVGIWVQPATLGTGMTFVSKVAGASIQWWLGRDKANHMLFAVRNAAGQLRVAYAAAATNDLSWHHVAGVYDGTKISLYVD